MTTENESKHVLVARKFLNRTRIWNDELFMFINSSYTSNRIKIEHEIQEEWANARSKDINEVFNLLMRMAPSDIEPSPVHIAAKNKVLCVSDWTYHDPSPEIFTINQIPHSFIPPEEIPLETRNRVSSFLESFSNGDVDRVGLLQEIMGLCLLPDTITNKIFMLVGEGNNGKTVFMKFLRRLLGSENISTQTLSQLTSRFGPYGVYKKLAVLADETIDGDANIEILKQLSGGSHISAEVKYAQAPINFASYATIIFAGNRLPVLKNYGKAEARRFVYILFEHDFAEEKKNGADAEIQRIFNDEAAMSFALHIAVEGLRRVLNFKGEVTLPEEHASIQKQHESESDPVVSFVDDHGGGESFIGFGVRRVWNEYKHYVEENYSKRFEIISIKAFGRRFREVTGLKSMTKSYNGQVSKVYTL